MRSLLIAICAAAAFALWVNGARAESSAGCAPATSYEVTGVGMMPATAD